MLLLLLLLLFAVVVCGCLLLFGLPRSQLRYATAQMDVRRTVIASKEILLIDT